MDDKPIDDLIAASAEWHVARDKKEKAEHAKRLAENRWKKATADLGLAKEQRSLAEKNFLRVLRKEIEEQLTDQELLEAVVPYREACKVFRDTEFIADNLAKTLRQREQEFSEAMQESNAAKAKIIQLAFQAGERAIKYIE